MRRNVVLGGLLLIAVSMVLGATVFREEVAQAAQSIVVANDASNPVPVKPPLWQGTPYIESRVIFGSGCEDLAAIPAGQVLFAQRAIVDFNVAPGRTGSAAIRFTPLGAANSKFVDIPAEPSAPAQQVAGIYDRYQGVIELGQPATGTPQGCFFAGSEDVLRGTIMLMGFLVPAS
jgi:hypothetical protein